MRKTIFKRKIIRKITHDDCKTTQNKTNSQRTLGQLGTKSLNLDFFIYEPFFICCILIFPPRIQLFFVGGNVCGWLDKRSRVAYSCSFLFYVLLFLLNKYHGKFISLMKSFGC